MTTTSTGSKHALRHLEARKQEPTVRPVFLFNHEAKDVANSAAEIIRRNYTLEREIVAKAVMGDGVWFPALIVDGKEAQVRVDKEGNPREVHFIGPNQLGANIPEGHRWSIDLVTGVITGEHW